MALPDRGCADWFHHMKALIIRDARAFDDVAAANHAICRLVTNWANTDDDIKAALHISAIMSYGRPFTHPQPYPVRRMKSGEGFDLNLHRHILELRHKLIAHSDEDYAEGWVRVISVVMEPDTTKVKVQVPHTVHVRTTTLHSIHSETLAKSYSAHMDAVISGVWSNLRDHSQDYLRATHEFNKTFQQLSSADGKTPTMIGEELKLSAEKSVHTPMEVLMDRQSRKVPPLTMAKDGYVYRSRETMVSFEDVRIKFPDGSEVAIVREQSDATKKQ